MHPEPPFLLLPLLSGLDEEDEAPSSAPGHGDQTSVLSCVRQSRSMKQRLGVGEQEQGGRK